MDIKPIKTETDYRKALKKLETVFDAPAGTPESDVADVLAVLVDEYEKKHYAIEAPDPIEAIKIKMEEMGIKQVDLADAIGGASRVSEILNRKRKLTVEMIRQLTHKLHISPMVLINDYPLAK